MNKQQQIEWHEEYYPEEAENFQPKYNRTWLEAAEHSLKKWEGLQEILDSHKGVDLGRFTSSETCALCKRSSRFPFLSDCDFCPVTLSGHKGCAESGSAYEHAIFEQDATIMTECLEDVIAFIEESDFDVNTEQGLAKT